ncbi:MAG TPA: hypothetical protein DFR83_16030 [Deltaproteobacteria bacterium]|nr:hypothetical protein [Deltaproteobacteria bacterium]
MGPLKRWSMVGFELAALLGFGASVNAASNEGSSAVDMDVIQVVLLEKGPSWSDKPSPVLDALQADHLAYVEAMWQAGQVEVCGDATLPSAELQRICIYRTPKPSIAQTWAAQDPAVLAGHFSVRVVSWELPAHWVTFPNSQRPGNDDDLLSFADFAEDDFIDSLGLSNPVSAVECTDASPDPTRQRFDDVESWTAVFDEPSRDDWQQPSVVVALLGLQKGMIVADIGAGTGYFNRHLAAAVGRKGKVFAVDIERSMVDHMAERAVSEGTPQVVPRLAQADDAGLLPQEVDRILLVDSYRHIDDRVAYFTQLRAALRPGGLLVVVDYRPGPLLVGPPPDSKLSPDQVTGELERAGWMRVEKHEVLENQIVLVFEVPN